MIDIRPILLLAIALAVPAWLNFRQREDLLVKWICLTCAVDIFDPHLIVNLPAARVAGLVLLPSALAALPAVRQSKAGKNLLYYLIYLGCMGIVFGFIFPWSSAGFDRLPTQLSEARVVIYFVRKAADLSLLIFLARYLWKTARPDRLIEWFVYGTSVAAVGGIFQWLTHVDFYSAFTGSELLGLDDRMRGFNYEPRGLGLLVGQGLLLALMLYGKDRSRRRLALLLLHTAAFFLAVSTSGLFVVAAGTVALIIVDSRTRKIFATPAVLALSLAAAILFVSVGGIFVDSWLQNVALRLSSDKEGSAPTSGIEDFALRQDIFDASAIMLLATRPAFLITGVGPGLSGLASSDYVPLATMFAWAGDQGAGLNSAPQVGLLRELCDVGFVGLLFLWIFAATSGRALSRLACGIRPDAECWRMARTAFWVAIAIYLVQASPLSASLCLFLAMGLSATWLAPIRKTALNGLAVPTRKSFHFKGADAREGATT